MTQKFFVILGSFGLGVTDARLVIGKLFLEDGRSVNVSFVIPDHVAIRNRVHAVLGVVEALGRKEGLDIWPFF